MYEVPIDKQKMYQLISQGFKSNSNYYYIHFVVKEIAFYNK